nr:immunoglobulin light chain junction region [Macaca mulatta]MOV74328.1 immunoglobulin light chain junction region [Macaca mulatta]MOV75012.1 immunoglobulin light chain junction region [Macaca mulatta]MOV75563.1 immunoglobulin light chain junction region [Macaca mulatta]MOV75753.1 immunoglobulin light chain junction region [Macaca mulatta]
CMQYTHIPYSF